LRREDHLVWIDMEMSGLEVEKETILEIATVITDKDLEVVAEGPVFAIHHPEEVLDAMDEWNTQHHAESGLTNRVRHSTITMKDAEEQTLSFLRRYTHLRKSPLCGNSIHQDRMFMRLYMPKLEAYLHYRNVDVSSIKEPLMRVNDDTALARDFAISPPALRRGSPGCPARLGRTPRQAG